MSTPAHRFRVRDIISVKNWLLSALPKQCGKYHSESFPEELVVGKVLLWLEG